MISIRRALALIVGLSSAVTAFADTAQTAGAPQTQNTSAEATYEEYFIQPGDLLAIEVWKEKDLQREILVRPDGGINFPLVGEMTALERTASELQSEIAEKLKKFIPDPVVTVSVRKPEGHKIYVVGKVARPGEFATLRQVDVIQALSMAGGPTPFASVNNIKVLRREGTSTVTFPFRYGDIEDGTNLEQNILLRGGDVVVVP